MEEGSEAGPTWPAFVRTAASDGVRDGEPRYLEALRSGALAEKVGLATAGLARCEACPRRCGVDRSADEAGVCRIGRDAWVASAGPHHGEEDVLRGWRGSGTVFFSGCNLRCVFCQNDEISSCSTGTAATAEELADVMLALQARGCHNINLVTPEHVVPQVLAAVLVAARAGLRLPLVYNTSAYDSPSSLAHLDGVVDIYMPDFKVWSSDRARRWLGAEDYPEVAREAIRCMHRQVGDLVVDASGLALRGLLVRHLVMPGAVDEARQVFRFLAREVSPWTYVNVMDQYHPAGRVLRGARAPELARRTSAAEAFQAVGAAREEGLRRIDGGPNRLL